MAEAKRECRGNILNNFRKEDEQALEPIQDRDSLTTMLQVHPCPVCDRKMLSVEHRGCGWVARCKACDAVWPDVPVPVLAEKYPKLSQVLNQLNVTINVINNNNVTNVTNVNNYLGTEGTLDFHADFTDDALEIFADPTENALFVESLIGTDMRLSNFAVHHFRNRFHCTGTRQWYEYRGHCWQEEAAELAYKEALGDQSFVRHYQRATLHFENMPIQTDDVKRKAKLLRKLCMALEDGKFRERIVADSVMKFHLRRPDFAILANTQNILVFQDGVYDFDTGTFGPGSPDIPVTMCVPQEWRTYDADNEHVRFLMKFFEDICPNEDVRVYLIRVLGACLTQDMLQYFFIFTGSGGNGKGRLLTLFEECLGPYYQSVSPTMLTRKREDAGSANEALSSLMSARVAVFQEAEASDIIQAGTVKAFTGGDTLSSRQLYGRQKKWKAHFKSIFVCNNLPRMSEDTWALWRRVICIQFLTAFVENPVQSYERKIDYDLDAKLKVAAPWLLSILIEYQRRYKGMPLGAPAAVREVTERYRDAQDIVKEFVQERLQNVIGASVSWLDLYAAYNSWPQRRSMQSKDLKRELANHGVRYQNTHIAGVKFCGVKDWKLV
jgi:P4 family phage/plasmid primase-like protien